MKTQLKRRQILGLGLFTVPLIGTAQDSVFASSGITPMQTAGPFYPGSHNWDNDADLTQIADAKRRATGQLIQVRGRVLAADGTALAKARIEIWQANHFGRYAHRADDNPAPLDKYFQGAARLNTNQKGQYGFFSIQPGAYPVSADWKRPPHIHFRVSAPGFRTLTTQMYFAGHPLNKVDAILNAHSPEGREKLLVTFSRDRTKHGDALFRGEFNLILGRT